MNFRSAGKVLTELKIQPEYHDEIYRHVTLGEDLSSAAEDLLYEALVSEMPYGTAKARTGDPSAFIFEYLDAAFEAESQVAENNSGNIIEIGDYNRANVKTADSIGSDRQRQRTKDLEKLNDKMLEESVLVHKLLKAKVEQHKQQILTKLEDSGWTDQEKQDLLNTFEEACWNRTIQNIFGDQ